MVSKSEKAVSVQAYDSLDNSFFKNRKKPQTFIFYSLSGLPVHLMLPTKLDQS